MGDVLFHSTSSANRFGGIPEDYMEIHKYMDDTKSHISDWRHRLFRHNSLFIEDSERIFGIFWTLKSTGKKVSTRTIVTQHIQEDLGFVPTAADWVRELPLKNWMNGATPDQRKKFQTLCIDPDEKALQWVPTKIFWQGIKNLPTATGVYLIAISEERAQMATYNKSTNSWSNIPAPHEAHEILYWAELPATPVGENLPH